MSDAQEDPVDAIVVGAGPAGISAAIFLARARRSVVVFDGRNTGRTDWGQTNHNYLGFPDGISVAELTARGRRQAEGFGARFSDLPVLSLEKVDGGFRARTHDTVQDGRAVVLATGVQDRWVMFPGYEDFVATSLHHCIVCDGYEVNGKRLLVVGTDDDAAEMAVQLLAHSRHVTLLCEGGPDALPEPKAALLRRRGIEVVPGCITAARARAPGYFAAVILDDGRELRVDHIFSVQGAEPNTQLADALGVQLNELGYIRADAEGHTTVPGVFAAGDVTRLFSHLVITAAHEGAAAALALDYWLYRQDGEVAADGTGTGAG